MSHGLEGSLTPVPIGIGRLCPCITLQDAFNITGYNHSNLTKTQYRGLTSESSCTERLHVQDIDFHEVPLNLLASASGHLGKLTPGPAPEIGVESPNLGGTTVVTRINQTDEAHQFEPNFPVTCVKSIIIR